MLFLNQQQVLDLTLLVHECLLLALYEAVRVIQLTL